MPHPVIVLGGLPAALVLPVGFVSIPCSNLDDLRAAAAARDGEVIVLVVADRWTFDAPALRRSAPGATLVAVAAADVPGADLQVRPDSGELGRVLCHLTGERRRMLGDSPAMRRAAEILARAAIVDVSVLVLGETGTGKELAARLLHDGSPRARGPFIAVNCAALPENLVESELFGHEAGAFTGALRRRIGRLEQADHGTLFLDEIGDLPAGAQAKLLRALQERVIERVGGTDTIAVDLRLVAATNRDLAADMASRAFRRDLFYRLAVVSVRLPALRERRGDIPVLAEHFLAAAMAKMSKRGLRLSDHALASMEAYPWPGNVRELENLMLRLAALSPSDTVIGPEHLGLVVETRPIGGVLPSAQLHDLLDFCEREIIRRVLERHGGNRTHAAKVLGVSRQALQQKLARFRTADPAGDPS